jgi:DNA-binding LytR/AlgR family response regulator
MENLIKVCGKTSLEPNDVSYFQADENYTIIHYYSGLKSIVPTTLKNIENKIGIEQGFIRPNRMLLINLKFINNYIDGEISLNNKSIISISRRREPALHSILKNHCNK